MFIQEWNTGVFVNAIMCVDCSWHFFFVLSGVKQLLLDKSVTSAVTDCF